MIERDSFVYDQKKMIALPEGSTLEIPDSLAAQQLLIDFKNTEIDVNIPEFKLNIFQDSILLHTLTALSTIDQKFHLFCFYKKLNPVLP